MSAEKLEKDKRRLGYRTWVFFGEGGNTVREEEKPVLPPAPGTS
tara:strand:- start:395 stop:526 length:132 start_codon:yes stop_codon:yes gene_type:complete